ncbi:TetR/AcrR family tetracycline transcriptional repressor [Nocardioides zeae]|uniref:TetR/AcrR family tetracycline transcriptional repressor n=1 Tax=Nocardioides zeae TaxID=1457234 RepID=A0ACC6IKN4_9ACTN|nr:TetR family transcriptional regulator [Nocardioides zeae]MDR6175284.1 TetR/AcrR family tetracycline transcriptional repressor [Nocardioides zeae]MDR6211224.1 TetR/AcrR family tetracycline transcriptional repressor [Nocardioides zeae]
MAAVRYHRETVVARAVEVLDRFGLADLSMRRLGTELGVQPSALYHHFPSKQALLAAVADEILERTLLPTAPDAPWDEQVAGICAWVRDATLAYRDGAELVATVWSFGLGASTPYEALVAALRRAPGTDTGVEQHELPEIGARTLLHFVFGHATDEQTQLQAASAGAIEDLPRGGADFAVGLGIILDGLRARVRA